jgi:hypothetical protein
MILRYVPVATDKISSIAALKNEKYTEETHRFVAYLWWWWHIYIYIPTKPELSDSLVFFSMLNSWNRYAGHMGHKVTHGRQDSISECCYWHWHSWVAQPPDFALLHIYSHRLTRLSNGNLCQRYSETHTISRWCFRCRHFSSGPNLDCSWNRGVLSVDIYRYI